jgi:hypothetical protein
VWRNRLNQYIIPHYQVKRNLMPWRTRQQAISKIWYVEKPASDMGTPEIPCE